MPDGSEFQTAGAASLKPRDAKVVQCEHEEQTTGQRLQSVENVWGCGNPEGSVGKQIKRKTTEEMNNKNRTNLVIVGIAVN